MEHCQVVFQLPVYTLCVLSSTVVLMRAHTALHSLRGHTQKPGQHDCLGSTTSGAAMQCSHLLHALFAPFGVNQGCTCTTRSCTCQNCSYKESSAAASTGTAYYRYCVASAEMCSGSNLLVVPVCGT